MPFSDCFVAARWRFAMRRSMDLTLQFISCVLERTLGRLVPSGKPCVLAASLLMLALFSLDARAVAPVPVVAAENFYGDLVAQLGGDAVSVFSILENPDQDPHLFEASVSTARRLSAARLVVYNGLGYDPWMEKMLRASANPARIEISAAALVPPSKDANPHLWYALPTVIAVARTVSQKLTALDPSHKKEFDTRLAVFEQSLAPLQQQIDSLRQQYLGVAVTATEPVFGYMAEALGFQMRNISFQWAIMNDTEPAASDIVALEKDLNQRRVRVLFFNRQASGKAAQRAKNLALRQHIPVVGVSETLPTGMHYQDWMLSQLRVLAKELAAAKP